MIRILSWNVNGIRATAKKGLFSWLLQEAPDFLCLQETKAHPEQVPELLEVGGYRSVWRTAEKKGYSGVAVYYRQEPLAVHSMGVEEFDAEGRVVALEYEAFVLIDAYFPNSQGERARLPYKLRFVEGIGDFCDAWRAKGKPVVLCGDYNIAHQAIDLARPADNEDSPGYYIEERRALSAFLARGYVDSYRHLHKEGGRYSWWSYRAAARERNVGWRIDYHCLDARLLPKLTQASIHADVMGSDHCPVGLELDLTL